jgi:hypothetical protein
VSPVWNTTLIGLDIPLAALVGITGRWKIFTCTKEIYKRKA